MMYSYIHKQTYIQYGHPFELVRPRKGQDLEQTQGQEVADVNEVLGLLGMWYRGCTIDLPINPRNYIAISSGKSRLLACLPGGES